MGRWLLIPISALLIAVSPAPVYAQSLKGVWKVVQTTSARGERNDSPQPGLYIFTDRYYSIQWITAARPFFRDNPTDQEKLSAWAPFTANSGTYEVKANTLATRPVVAKNPAVMTGAGGTAELRFEGDHTVYVTATNPTGATIKLQRVE